LACTAFFSFSFLSFFFKAGESGKIRCYFLALIFHQTQKDGRIRQKGNDPSDYVLGFLAGLLFAETLCNNERKFNMKWFI